ncbi:Single-stranded DNA-binding protein why2, mitochondrial [Orobanche hederae]
MQVKLERVYHLKHMLMVVVTLFLCVVNNIYKTNDRFVVPVTTAEFAVMRTAFTFALPHIMGWDWLTNQQQPHHMSASKRSLAPAAVPDLQSTEWDR